MEVIFCEWQCLNEKDGCKACCEEKLKYIKDAQALTGSVSQIYKQTSLAPIICNSVLFHFKLYFYLSDGKCFCGCNNFSPKNISEFDDDSVFYFLFVNGSSKFFLH